MKDAAIVVMSLALGMLVGISASDVGMSSAYAKVSSDGYCVYSNQVYRMEPVTGYEESL